MEKKHESPPRNSYSMLPIMHGIDYYSEKSKYYLIIKKHCMYVFYTPSDFADCTISMMRAVQGSSNEMPNKSKQ